MTPSSIYTPEGSFAYLLAAVGVTLLAAVGYLLVFTGMNVPF